MVNEKPFKLDMPLDEALRRFVQTDEKEIAEHKKLNPKKAGSRSPPAKRVSADRHRRNDNDRQD
jgi:hypothetical protein